MLRMAVALSIVIVVGLLPAAAIEPPPSRTFPSTEPAFRLVRENAYQSARAGDVAATRMALDDYERLVREVKGEASREFLDMLIDAAELSALAGDNDPALDRVRRAVALARLNAVAYFAHSSDPAVRALKEDQQLAFQTLVDVAAESRSRAADTAIDDEAFRAMQMAALDRASLTWWSRHLLPRLGRGDLHDRARLILWLADMLEPIRTLQATGEQLLPDLVSAGLTTDEEIAFANGQIELSNEVQTRLGPPDAALADAVLPRTYGLSEVKARLGPDDALVAFLAGADGLMHSFAMTDRGHVFASPFIIEEEIVGRIQALRAAMGVPAARSAAAIPQGPKDDAAMLRLAHELYEKLFGPVESVIASRSRLFIVAGGELAKFPFEALVTQAPSVVATPENAAWLVRRHAVSVLPGLPALMETDSAVGKPGLSSFLAFADPAYAALAGTHYNTHATADVSQLPPLPESASEAAGIAAAFSAGATVLTGVEANETRLARDNLSGELAKAQILLFATHGLVPGETGDAFEPALALAPDRQLISPGLLQPLPGQIKSDGMLTATEISGLKLAARLVILSACNTGVESAIDNEGYSGLARGFLAAGARTVLVTHWPVNSDAAVRLTTEMFAAGGTVAERLRAAELKLIEGGGEFAHPRYWAPFAVYGDPWVEIGAAVIP